MPDCILVINPNSTVAVTRAIDEAMAPLRFPGGPEIQCLTLEEGPPGVESQLDADGVILPLCRMIREHDAEPPPLSSPASATPACFGAREHVKAGSRHRRMWNPDGADPRSSLWRDIDPRAIVARHLRYIGAMGVTQRLAGDLPVGLGVTELADRRTALARMVEVGHTLRDQHGAEVLVMGCAGMARYRADLEKAVRIPVVEPTQAAVTMAIGGVRLAQV